MMMVTSRETDAHALQVISVTETNHGEGGHLDTKPKSPIVDCIEDATDRLKQLDEGFYEIEAVRQRRNKMGRRQYLIKWRGWPETSNTWEPLENLLSCADVIDAFEKSVVPKKRGRRKKKPGDVCSTEPKRKQSSIICSPPKTGRLDTRVMVECILLPTSNNSDIIDARVADTCGHVEDHLATAVNNETVTISDMSRSTTDFKDTIGTGGLCNDDILINDLKGDTPDVGFQETKGIETGLLMKELSMLGCVERGQRCTGSRRRKSGSVKRFQRDAVLNAKNDNTENTVPQISSLSDEEMQKFALTCHTLGCNDKFDVSKNLFPIIEIIKPICYASHSSNNQQEVSITFMALRSDGIEVMVDNTYLKNNYPLLLINFYEKHMRYTPIPYNKQQQPSSHQ